MVAPINGGKAMTKLLNDVQWLHNRARTIVTTDKYTTEEKLAKVIDLLNATAYDLDQPFICTHVYESACAQCGTEQEN